MGVNQRQELVNSGIHTVTAKNFDALVIGFTRMAS